VLGRASPFLSWKEHLKIAYYDGMALPEWSLDNPYSFIPAGRGPSTFSGDEPGSQPMTWRARHRAQDLPGWRRRTRTSGDHSSAPSHCCSVAGQPRVRVSAVQHACAHRRKQKQYEKLTGRCGVAGGGRSPTMRRRRCPPTSRGCEPHSDRGYRELATQLSESPSFQEWRKGWAGKPS
jgi:hypothetical protein